jgi:hypothetical protein
MWFAVTAKPVRHKRKERSKEFYRGDIEVILNAETQDLLEKKLQDTLDKFPVEMNKYLRAGIKIVEAENLVKAKRISKKVDFYFDHKGQYHFF